MSTSSLKAVRRYFYDPLDRLTGETALDGGITQRFYQNDNLRTELGGQTQRTIFRNEIQSLAQHQSDAAASETTLLATDQANSPLQALSYNRSRQIVYSAYGHHLTDSNLI
ncbi:hypothetical protein PS662_01804 [Pseudomonas fluorescens]|uniref:Teneurin-like YD-shell domain-containing protein n=1 Tax=Pseudomonas fluorescens TaxID=294 RepID=A0A5E6RS55_PSEFL|nr:hypothetical protein [Pseudomonas fluorescens]VVM71071.1 hypothetical protein PS662_01804 [Pseudomonas fluorescens]